MTRIVVEDCRPEELGWADSPHKDLAARNYAEVVMEDLGISIACHLEAMGNMNCNI